MMMLKEKLNVFDFKGAIFDLDGTLLDSMNVWYDVDREFFARFNLALTDDYSKAISALNFDKAAEYTINRYNLDLTVEQVVNIWYEMAQRKYALDVVAFEGAKEILERYKQNGTKIALATSSTENLFTPALKRLGLYDYFDAFCTSEEIGKNKDFPDIYKITAQKLGLAPNECIVYEDIEKAVNSAKKAGCVCVAKKNPLDRLTDSDFPNADLIIHNFREIL